MYKKSKTKDLIMLKSILHDCNMEDKEMSLHKMNLFDKAMYRIQILGKVSELRNSKGYENMRSRVKSTKSIMNKYAYLETTDLTAVQDILAMTIIKPTINECYQVFEDFLKRGFIPYYKLLDTLKNPINKYQSLDTYFKNDIDSFELQIRLPDSDKSYISTHGEYKDRTTPLKPKVEIVQRVRKLFETIEASDKKEINSIFDLLVEASPNPKMCYEWRIFNITPELDSILSKYNISTPTLKYISSTRVFI